MHIRTAEPADRPAVRDVARRSLQASYSLSPQAIVAAVEEWYDESELGDRLADDEYLLLVAETGGQPVGFADSRLSPADGEATLLWLHVDPAYRGEGVADALFEHTRERLSAAGIDRLSGRVLEDNADGNAFYEEHAFERVGRDEVEIAGRTHVEHVWTNAPDDGVATVETDDGTVYVDRDEPDSGSVARFYRVYEDKDQSSVYGYYCGNCERLANAMDAMGRIECDGCGNARKPTRWDAAYL